MHAYMRRGLEVALMVGGGILFFAGQASADEGTTGAHSALGGNQATVSVVVPVTLAGNSISVLGDSGSSGAASTAPTAPAAPAAHTTSGEHSVAGGNQAAINIAAPITVSGNSVAVLGDSHSAGSTASAPAAPPAPAPSGSAGAAGDSPSGEDSVAGGNQVTAPVVAPVTAGGNAVSVLGDSSSTGSTASAPAGSGPATAGDSTSGEDSVAGGNQVTVPVTAPITLGGNAISVVGDSTTSGSTTTVPVTPGGQDPGGQDPGDNPGDPGGSGDNPGGSTGGQLPPGDASGGAGGAGGQDGSAGLVASALPSVATSSLAMTGSDPWGLLLLAGLLLLLGAGIQVTTRRFAAVT